MDKIQEKLLISIKALSKKTDEFDKEWRLKHSEHSEHALHYQNKKWYCKHLVGTRNRKFQNQVNNILSDFIPELSERGEMNV